MGRIINMVKIIGNAKLGIEIDNTLCYDGYKLKFRSMERKVFMMLIGTYLDLFTGDFDSVCVYDYEEFVHYLHERGKNVLLLTADPEAPYFINAVVEAVDLAEIDWDEEEVVLNFRGEELS